jgi:hypothetical protein
MAADALEPTVRDICSTIRNKDKAGTIKKFDRRLKQALSVSP